MSKGGASLLPRKRCKLQGFGPVHGELHAIRHQIRPMEFSKKKLAKGKCWHDIDYREPRNRKRVKPTFKSNRSHERELYEFKNIYCFIKRSVIVGGNFFGVCWTSGTRRGGCRNWRHRGGRRRKRRHRNSRRRNFHQRRRRGATTTAAASHSWSRGRPRGSGRQSPRAIHFSIRHIHIREYNNATSGIDHWHDDDSNAEPFLTGKFQHRSQFDNRGHCHARDNSAVRPDRY